MPTEEPWDPPEPAAYTPPTEFQRERPPGAPTYPGPDPDAPPVARPHPGFWMALLWCGAFLLTTQVPGAVLAGVILAVQMLANPAAAQEAKDPGAMLESRAAGVALGVAFFVTEFLVIGVSWLVIRLVVGRQWPRILAVRRPGVAHLVLVLLGFPAMVLLANGAFEVLRNVLHVPSVSDLGLPGMEEMTKVFNQWPSAFAVLVIGLGPGIGEELWCRGFLGRGLVGRYGWLGVVATSFFFGLIHIDPCQGLMAMLMGLWLHFVYLTTRSLLVPMLLHFLNNSLAVVAGQSAFLKDIEENAGGIPRYVYATAGLLLAAVGYALYQSRARLAPANGFGRLLWHPPYPGVEYPPAGSGTVVVHPRPSLAATLVACAGFLAFLACCWLAFFRG